MDDNWKETLKSASDNLNQGDLQQALVIKEALRAFTNILKIQLATGEPMLKERMLEMLEIGAKALDDGQNMQQKALRLAHFVRTVADQTQEHMKNK